MPDVEPSRLRLYVPPEVGGLHYLFCHAPALDAHAGYTRVLYATLPDTGAG